MFAAFGRRQLLLVLAGLILAGWQTGFSADSAVSKEYQIKAAFIYNFTKFVEWPARSFAGTNSPIVIGVMGRNPFADELEKIAKDHTVNGRVILVKNLTSAAEVETVHLLFINAGEEDRWNEVLKSLRKSAVLTVGESERFAELGGIINFTLQGDKVRLEINLDTMEQAGLKINAQLLKLATVVRRKP